jgi:hypothetical protein
MEEFDIELDSDIGTSVSKIKNKEQNVNPNNEIVRPSDSDIDYDKVMEILHNSETKNNVIDPPNINYPTNVNYQPNQQINNIPIYVQDVRPKREINMNQFVKNIENVIDNKNINYKNNEPIPANLTKNMMNQIQPGIDIESFNQVPPVETIKMKQNEQTLDNKKETKNVSQPVKESNLTSSVFNFEYIDLMVYVLLFVLLNNKFVIELIYDRVPFIKSVESPYPNLILRSIIFGVLIFLIKKFNL